MADESQVSEPVLSYRLLVRVASSFNISPMRIRFIVKRLSTLQLLEMCPRYVLVVATYYFCWLYDEIKAKTTPLTLARVEPTDYNTCREHHCS